MPVWQTRPFASPLPKLMTAGNSGSEPFGQLIGAVRGIQHGPIESGIKQQMMNLLHVVVVRAEGTVFVFHLHGEDRAAIRALQWRKLLPKPMKPAASPRP